MQVRVCRMGSPCRYKGAPGGGYTARIVRPPDAFVSSPPGFRPGPARHVVRVDTGPSAYDILIGPGLLENPATWEGLPRSTHGVIVTNEVVGPLLAAQLARGLAGRHGRLSVLELPDGEAHKDWHTLHRIFDQMMRPYPSGGGLYPIELYAVLLNVSGCPVQISVVRTTG